MPNGKKYTRIKQHSSSNRQQQQHQQLQNASSNIKLRNRVANQICFFLLLIFFYSSNEKQLVTWLNMYLDVKAESFRLSDDKEDEKSKSKQN